MQGPQRRDINELLANGYFKTARGKDPSSSAPKSTNAPSSLKPNQHKTPYERELERSRSRPRGPHKQPPPRPIVEDEAASLAKENHAYVPNYEPPMRGIVDQNPILLEAEVTVAEAARLQSKEDDNPERRFVFIRQSGTNSSNDDNIDQTRRRTTDSVKSIKKGETKDTQRQPGREEGGPRLSKRQDKNEAPRPPIDRRGSRQDLPSLETKVPRAIPPQFRRSVSAYASTPRHNETPKTATTGPRTPAENYFLSPQVMRGQKDYFSPSQSAPRTYTNETSGGRTPTSASDKRNSGSFSGSRPGTPLSDKRNSGNSESGKQSRRNSNEKPTRPQKLSEESGGRRVDRHSSVQSERNSTARSSRSSTHSARRHHSSSEDDLVDSDSDYRSRKYRSNKLRPDDDYDRHLRSPSRANKSTASTKPSSRYTSPLPSPKVSPSQIPRGDQFERSETFPQTKRASLRPASPNSAAQETPRADKLNPLEASVPRPGSRQSSDAPIIPMRPQAAASTASLPIPIPPSRIDVHSPGETRRSPTIPQASSPRPLSSKTPTVTEKPPWQPPKFQPPSANLEKPMGSYRRYSQDLQRGSIVPLPPCPRISFIRGKNDWLTLPQCPSFDICPSCYNSTIAPTSFRSMFMPAPFRPAETEVLCDFGSSPWYRIAWLLTMKERRRDLKLFYGLANIGANVQPCLGKHAAIRPWHSIIDPKNGKPIRNFDVCYSCVKSIEVLLPSIRGVFVRTDHLGPPGVPRVCDLRFDSKRFVQYFDALETTADQADHDEGPPDTRELASLARRMALVEECHHDTDLQDRRWHIITQLPEFTVCEECFDEFVWPELEERKAIPMMFNKSLQRLPNASCQLYSQRMRDIFRTAVNGNDYKLLASKARERKTIEDAYKYNVQELKRYSRDPNSMATELERLEEEWRKWE